jgi:hypothetical protein
MLTRRRTAGAALALILATAGCGGSSRLDPASYQAKATAIVTRAQLAAPAALQPTGNDVRTLGPDLQTAANAYAKARDDVRGLHPPQSLASVHQRLVEALDGAAAAAGKAASDANAGRTTATEDDLALLAPAVERLASAERALTKAVS